MTNSYIYSLAVYGPDLFAGTHNSGVFLSTNNGTSWNAVNTGLTDTSVYSLATSGPYLFAGTGSGVWRRSLSEMVTGVADSHDGVPIEFSLNQNYPNPFNPTTTISYDLSANSFVTLKVYDILGREVATLVNERENAGTYSVKFDGSRLASGIYFYRLTAGSYISTRKLALMK